MGERTDLEVAPVRRPTRTRVDMAWLTEVTERLSRHPQRRPGLRLYTNTCAFEHDGRIYHADPGTGGSAPGRTSPCARRASCAAS